MDPRLPLLGSKSICRPNNMLMATFDDNDDVPKDLTLPPPVMAYFYGTSMGVTIVDHAALEAAYVPNEFSTNNLDWKTKIAFTVYFALLLAALVLLTVSLVTAIENDSSNITSSVIALQVVVVLFAIGMNVVAWLRGIVVGDVI